MRAQVGAIKACAVRREQCAESLLHRFVVGNREAAARDTRLVGDNDDAVAGVVEPPNRLGGTRQQLDLVRLVQKSWILDDRAVAIEEDRAGAVSHQPSVRLSPYRSVPERLCGHQARRGSPPRAR